MSVRGVVVAALAAVCACDRDEARQHKPFRVKALADDASCPSVYIYRYDETEFWHSEFAFGIDDLAKQHQTKGLIFGAACGAGAIAEEHVTDQAAFEKIVFHRLTRPAPSAGAPLWPCRATLNASDADLFFVPTLLSASGRTNAWRAACAATDNASTIDLPYLVVWNLNFKIPLT